MHLGQKIGLVISGFVLALLGAGFLLLDGDLDFGGEYIVLQTVPYSPSRVAFLIERTDHQAMSGDRYAVLIDDHTPTAIEQKHALISFWRHRSFQLPDPGISITWSGPNQITLTTKIPEDTPAWVSRQVPKIGDVAVSYISRP